MELTMNMSAFEELDNREMMGVDGGGKVGTAVGLTVATVAVAWAAPVGLIAGSAWVAGALALGGAGLFGKLTGLY